MRYKRCPYSSGGWLVVLLVAINSVPAIPPSWQSTYSMTGFMNSEPLDACEGFGGGIVICGGAYNDGPAVDGHGFLMKIDQTSPSAPEFQVIFDPFNNGACANSVRRLDGEDYYLIAGSSNMKSKSSHPMLMLIDDNGNVVQSSEIASLYGYGIDAFVAEDGDYILSGETWVGPASRQCFIARVSGTDMSTVEWNWVFREEISFSDQRSYFPWTESRIYSNCVLEVPSSYPAPYAGKILAGICSDPGTSYPIPQYACAVSILLSSSGNELLRNHMSIPCIDSGG